LAKGRLAKATGVPQVTVPVEQFWFPCGKLTVSELENHHLDVREIKELNGSK